MKNLINKAGVGLAVVGTSLLPFVALAAPDTFSNTGVQTVGGTGATSVTGTIGTITGVINRLQNIINVIIPFIVGLAVLVIIWGIFSFISSAGDEEARAKAKSFIIWGIIGVFLMLSVWGLVNILTNSLPVDNAFLKSGDLINQRSGIPVVSPTGGTSSF